MKSCAYSLYAEALKSYPAKSFDAIASDLGVSAWTVSCKAKRLGIATVKRERRPRRVMKRVVFGGELVSMHELCGWLLSGGMP